MHRTVRASRFAVWQNMETTKSGIVEELKEKHKERLARAQQQLRKRMGKPAMRFDSYGSDVWLFQKWAYRVGKGWYGFSLGSIPRVWRDVLDDFLTWLESECPDFEIHQVKMKWRSLRFYVGTKRNLFIPGEKIRSEISQLQRLLTMPQLPPPVKKRKKASAQK